VPYHSYESVVQFFEKAADDPDVTHIKIVQYRVASSSRIMEAMMRAVQAGKNVSAFIEVKARFDEEANLRWGEKLEKAGVKVRYSFPGLKVHAKVALVRRMVNGQPVLYSYLSTGNFHEKTAKIYSDFGLFTADRRITSEVTQVFTILETVKLPESEFEHLLVGQFNLRSELNNLILKEIENAQLGRKAEIILKLNNLQDHSIIDLLYEASQKGVRIKLIVRGICCLVPGVKGISENISCVSIVDRYLEHARIFIFHNGGDEKIYLSSADWMTRNLSYRIETVFPVYDEKLKKVIKDLVSIQLSDNVKSRIIDKEGKNQYIVDTGDIPVQSQIETYYYFKRLGDRYLKQRQEEEEKVSQNES
jgi:polyphosphate kinase